MNERVEKYMGAWRAWRVADERNRNAAWNELAPLVNALSRDEHAQVLELQAAELEEGSK